VKIRIPIEELVSVVNFWSWLVAAGHIGATKDASIEIEEDYILFPQASSPGSVDFWDVRVSWRMPGAAYDRGSELYWAVPGGLGYPDFRPRDPSRGFIVPIWSDGVMSYFDEDPFKRMTKNPMGGRIGSKEAIPVGLLQLISEFFRYGPETFDASSTVSIEDDEYSTRTRPYVASRDFAAEGKNFTAVPTGKIRDAIKHWGTPHYRSHDGALWMGAAKP